MNGAAMNLADLFTAVGVGFTVYAVLLAVGAVGRINRKGHDDELG